MAKRIHQIAKELNVSSKEIINYLKENTEQEKEKTASSGLADHELGLIMNKFGNTGNKENHEHTKTVKSAETEKSAGNTDNSGNLTVSDAVRKNESEKAEKRTEKEESAAQAAKPKKKSHITAVFNPQNSKLSKNKRPNNRKGQNGGRVQHDRHHRKAESAEGSLRPGFERISSPMQLKERAAAGMKNQKQAQGKAQDTQSAAVKPANAPNTQNTQPAVKPQDTKAETPKTPETQPVKAAEVKAPEKPVVPTDSLKLENAIKKPVVKIQGNIYSNMNKKPEARKNENKTERNGKNSSREKSGNRNFQNNRSSAGNSQTDRGGHRFNQNRKTEGKGRLEQEITRFNQNAVKVSSEETKSGRDGRDNRERDRERENNKKNRRNYESGKKQERYINLEKNGGKKKNKQPQPPKPQEKEEETIKTLTLPDSITIKDLADMMKVQPSALIKKLFLQGKIVTVNQEVDFDTAEEIALEFNCICEHEVKVDVIEELLREEEDDESQMVSRPPVVCVMGHVDHGKTSLLDAIRETRVTDREAGGITQHIGASVVSINNQTITFLDTPGHEAFTAMRMRGANSTDIAILVVAADDGVMPQTIEAINHAKAAGIEIIVAINKIDKPSANIERVKQELSEYELIPEDWGGSTIFVPVSAHTHEGIDQLLEMILLTAEICELKANPKRSARGLVIEAQLDKGRGTVATVLVQKGTLKVGDPIAAGSSFGKVRAMIDDKGKRVKEAGPSTPVEILGLSSVPNAGEIFVSTSSEKEARSFADTFVSQGKEKLLEETKSKMSLDDLFSQIQAGNLKELDIIVKADVQGSVEAVKQSLVKLSNDEVVVKIIHGGVGAINESDIILASASNAIVIGFNVRPDPTAKATAEREGVDVRLYKVIYNAIEDVEAAMKGMLDPVFEEKVIGHAEIRQIFKASGVGNIAGSYVLDGIFERGCKIRISREGEQLFDGALASLKRFKDDVKEVRAGYECGLVFEGFHDFAELDIVEAYKMVEVPR